MPLGVWKIETDDIEGMEKLPSISVFKLPLNSVFLQQLHSGDEKLKTMILRGCVNFQWHIGDALPFFNGIHRINLLLFVSPLPIWSVAMIVYCHQFI